MNLQEIYEQSRCGVCVLLFHFRRWFQYKCKQRKWQYLAEFLFSVRLCRNFFGCLFCYATRLRWKITLVIKKRNSSDIINRSEPLERACVFLEMACSCHIFEYIFAGFALNTLKLSKSSYYSSYYSAAFSSILHLAWSHSIHPSFGFVTAPLDCPYEYRLVSHNQIFSM